MSHSTCHQCGQPLTGDGPCPTCMWQFVRTPDQSTTVPHATNGLPVIPGHEIIEELARGGMGIVYRAQQKDPHREVALKMLLPFDNGRRDVRERFQLEINALAELDHPGILPLYQVGDTGGRPWFTMKLAAGGSLATRLKRKRNPSDPRGAANLLAGMADAVQHAHAHGVLHRDIKPGNILFDERGGAYLADFGLAKLLDSTADMTHSAAVLGTPCYMAPEVAEKGAKSATISSDVYGLGAVLYELLSGRPPFIVEGMAAMVKKVIEDEPDRPSTIAAHVPRDLELVCLKCLAKDPRQRYASAADVAADLRRWLNGEPVTARRAGTVVRLWAWARRRPALATVSAALILALAGGSISLAILNYKLNRTVKARVAAQTRADVQSESLIGKFADALEKVGRLQLILDACAIAAANDEPVDDAGHMRRARLLKRWASALWAKGDSADAVPKLREAVESMDALVSRVPDNKEAFALVIETRCRLAEALADTTSFAGALTQLAMADRAVSSPGILALDDTLGLQAEVDRTRTLIWNRHRRDETETTIAAANRAVASFSNWQARDPGNRLRTLALAQAQREAGKAWYHGSGEHPDPPNLEQALPLFSKGADLMRALTDRSAAEDFELAYAVGWMGDCLLRMKDKGPAAAAPLHREEFEIVSKLTARDPLNGEWQHKLANSRLSLAEQHHEAARLMSDAGDQPAAEALEKTAVGHWAECLNILKSLHKEAPDVRNWAMNYLIALRREGFRALKNGDSTTAAALLGDCTKIAGERVTAMPDSITEREGWRAVTDDIAGILEKHGDVTSAADVCRRAVAIAAKEAGSAGPGQPWWEWTLLHFQRKVASTSRDAAALENWLAENFSALEQRAAAAGQQAAAHPASIPECEIWKNLTDDLGKLMEDRKDWPGALTVYRPARDLALRTAPLPGDGQLWWEWTLAHYHRRVATVSKEAGDNAAWLAENLPALEIRIRHFRSQTSFARRDPAAVPNAFRSTIDSQFAGGQPAAALASATRCLDLYAEFRASAGAPGKWAEPILKACQTAIPAGESHATSASALAVRAARELFPAAGRPALDETDLRLAEALEKLAAGK